MTPILASSAFHFSRPCDNLRLMFSAPPSAYWDQHPYVLRCEWGPRGVAALAPISDVVIIVDVISFCTCVDIAVARGATVYPFGWGDEGAADFARGIGGELVGLGHERLRLSAAAMLTVRAGARLVLPSPNGGALSALAAGAGLNPLPNPPPQGEGTGGPLTNHPPVGEGSGLPLPVGEGWGEGLRRWRARLGRRGRATEPVLPPLPAIQPLPPAAVESLVVFAGCLRNARAVAAAAGRAGQRVAVIPAGERWREDAHGDRSLRPAAEDLIGAGAILDRLPGRRSPEAELAVVAFRAARDRLPAFLLACSSGREHAAKGTEGDVALAAQLDVSDFAPRLVAGEYVAGVGEGP